MLTTNTIRDLLNDAPTPVLSLYLHVDPGHQPNQNDPRAWTIYVKNALRDIENSLDDDSEIAITDIRKSIENFVEGYTPTGKSLALFVGEDDYLEAFDIPVAIENQHAFGDINLVPMLWALDEYERYLVVLVDSEEARFMSAYLGRATTDVTLSIDFDDYDFGQHAFVDARSGREGMFRQSSGGVQFEDMKAEHMRRFYNTVAEQIRDIMTGMQSERIILGGNEKAAHQVKNLLHGTMQNKVVDILPIPMSANDSEVSSAIQETALAYEREQEMTLVDEVIGFAKAGGRGAIDMDV
ncbi:MAG: VLRF1 family aeRF1-type release factor, partial [Chloroflexota bacterium]